MSESSNPTRPVTDGSVQPDEATLYVRSLSPGPVRARQQSVIDRLEALADRDVLATANVSVWGERVCLDEGVRSEAGDAVCDQVQRLRAWARANDRTLEPVFEERRCSSALTEQTVEVLVLPVMVLVEYSDGSLHHVAPSGDGDAVQTVADRLDQLDAAHPRRQVA